MKLGGKRGTRTWPTHAWAGLALLAAGHFLIFARRTSGDLLQPITLDDYRLGTADINSWLRPFSDYWFAAVWFGYIFLLDAWIYRRDGLSLFMSQRRIFLAMFPISAAVWWGFEWINSFVGNWFYARPGDIPDWYANLVSCVFFSTVIPAVWQTADLIGGWTWVKQIPRLPGFRITSGLLVALIGLGVLSFVLPAIWPLYFFPLIWGFVALILDPINYKRGMPSILGYWSRGDWRVPVTFYLGGLGCGIFWELWNYWAFPKWFYDVPFVGFLKVFEMPVLGFLGYGPFAWELFAFFWFAASFVRGGEYATRFVTPEEGREAI